ncbi:MAG: hypothetical protein PHO53_03055 [Actinomycetota bacterium]|nr:hypothetical protein [Actinomycetota bacterium]
MSERGRARDDIFARLERIEEFIANSKKVPLSPSVLVNEAELYDLLDDIRVTLPTELKDARVVSKERERILSEARMRGEEIIAEAEQRAEQMVEHTEIVRQAELERDHIIDEAQEEARKIKYEAEDAADRIFGELEVSLGEVRDSTEEILRLIASWREKLHGYTSEEPEEAYPEEEEY